MNEPTQFFWNVAEPLLGEPGVSRGTMMGFPCLRYDGAFFASCDHRTGDLIVKLSRERVAELVGGVGEPFAPAGRVFREWVRVVERDRDGWEALLVEAKERAAS